MSVPLITKPMEAEIKPLFESRALEDVCEGRRSAKIMSKATRSVATARCWLGSQGLDGIVAKRRGKSGSLDEHMVTTAANGSVGWLTDAVVERQPKVPLPYRCARPTTKAVGRPSGWTMWHRRRLSLFWDVGRLCHPQPNPHLNS